ncbi:hypothetical protein [Lactiplantibacillus plantarum]|uniref:hypothetical protein n=1 Tax=Lactiplantibacillus plantarum TaxID=1590 RepID=UPI0015D4C0AC|nr:hypothetical protein [Lactiplantibacillus plantarum]
MKYTDAKKQIEALSSECSAYTDKDIDFFIINYKNGNVASVRTNEQYSVTVWFEKCFSKLPFSNKLYMILSELAMTPPDERVEEKKYYVKVYDSGIGYLNINNFTGKMSVNNISEDNSYKTKFTDKEIEQLKQREDIPLDWNKVRFMEAN